ncbi:GGDEF domain-containing protein [Deinococcus sp.]|uniref:GGDEF domain-containing protein n=1 Tax=Deinococcus sp. TaxID=47478 RepID=UPI0025C4ADC0|nr:GGDEF domain-containing protein [Deinococcus sp.]
MTTQTPYAETRQPVLWLGLMWLLCGLHLLWALFGQSQEQLLMADLLDLLVMAAGFGSAVWFWRNNPQTRKVTRPLVFASASQLMADAYMIVLDFVPVATPGFSPADVFYWLFYIFMGGTLLRLQRVKIFSGRSLIWLLSSLVVVSVTAEILWVTFLADTLLEPGTSLQFKAVNAGYILLDLFLLSLALMSPLWGRLSRASGLLFSGLLTFISADFRYYALSLQGQYVPGGLLDLLWQLGLSAQLSGIFMVVADRGKEPHPSEQSGQWLLALPYIAVIVSVALLFSHTDDNSLRQRGIIWFSVLTFVLMIILQALNLLENQRLQHSLHQQTQELEAHRNALAQLAFTDLLTGLGNRAAFYLSLQEAIDSAQSELLGLFFVDLDGFKGVNDRFGHESGDQLLRQVAQRLLGSVAPHGTAFRIGGDEFTVIFPDCSGQAEALALAEALILALRTTFTPAFADQVSISASVGVALARPGEFGADQLLRRADAAMYIAKGTGKDRVYLFTDTDSA